MIHDSDRITGYIHENMALIASELDRKFPDDNRLRFIYDALDEASRMTP